MGAGHARSRYLNRKEGGAEGRASDWSEVVTRRIDGAIQVRSNVDPTFYSLVGSGRSGGDHQGSSLLENPYIPYQCMDSYLSSAGLGSASMGKSNGAPNNVSSQTKNYEITPFILGCDDLLHGRGLWFKSRMAQLRQGKESKKDLTPSCMLHLARGDIAQLVELRSCNWVVAITGWVSNCPGGRKIHGPTPSSPPRRNYVSTTAYNSLKDHLTPSTRERESNTQPPSLSLQCCKSHHRRGNNRQVHEDNEEEEREYEEQLDDEDEEQSIDINASPKQSKDTPSPTDPRFSPPPRSQASDFQDWNPLKLKELNAKVKSLPLYVTFEEAWDKHDLVEFFFTTGETKEEVHKLFQKARFPIAPHAVNQPSSPPPTPPREWYVNSISREKLAEFNQFVQTLPASMSFQQAWRHYPFTTFFHNYKETPQDIKELFEKAKVKPTFMILYKIEDPGQFSTPNSA
ncbi:unnamed protein product [Microthlaspi erraticum]|uniref:Uncharacterized protein ycf68 n=2 Tax=Microthlaspi erraticum TaxID=1685480 RepID=A0A6D2LMW7_9BRAS|nr:unnamed protein product [Microthlaspi erraticum]